MLHLIPTKKETNLAIDNKYIDSNGLILLKEPTTKDVDYQILVITDDSDCKDGDLYLSLVNNGICRWTKSASYWTNGYGRKIIASNFPEITPYFLISTIDLRYICDYFNTRKGKALPTGKLKNVADVLHEYGSNFEDAVRNYKTINNEVVIKWKDAIKVTQTSTDGKAEVFIQDVSLGRPIDFHWREDTLRMDSDSASTAIEPNQVKNDFDVENDPAYLNEHKAPESIDLNKQLEAEAIEFVRRTYVDFKNKGTIDFTELDLLSRLIGFAQQSLVIKQYHQQGMFSEDTVRLILRFHAPYANWEAVIKQYKNRKP